MVTLLLSSAALAADPWLDSYTCQPTNPIAGSDFELFLSVDTRPDGEVLPVAVRLHDLETDSLRMQSAKPIRRPEYDLVGPDLDAWHFGEDSVAEYLLLVPSRDLRALEYGVTVTQVFGGGIAQWVNEFVCQLR